MGPTTKLQKELAWSVLQVGIQGKDLVCEQIDLLAAWKTAKMGTQVEINAALIVDSLTVLIEPTSVVIPLRKTS